MSGSQPSRESGKDPWPYWTLLVVCIATLILLLDVSAVNVALRGIQHDLRASLAQLQWVIDAYAVTLAALMLTAGTMADRVGRRFVFSAGLVLFVLASLLCGVSSSATMLDIARAIQGIGGAAMFATTLALLAVGYQGSRRGRAFAVWGAMSGGSIALGPVVGGVLVEHIGWRSIFFVNVPIGIVALALVLRTVDESKDSHPGRPDAAGLATFSSGLFLVTFALVRGSRDGWASPPILGCMIGAAGLLIAFTVFEFRHDRPMLDLTLFRKPAFAGVAIAAFVLSCTIFAVFPYIALYFQNTLGYSPLAAGLRFLPITVLSFGGAMLSGKLAGRVAPRFLLGAGLSAIGVGLLLMARLGADSGWTVLLAGFLISGTGVGLTNPAVASTAVGVVDPRRVGMAVGINNTFRQVGIATGVAGLGALLQSSVTSRMRASVGPKVHLPPPEALAQGASPDTAVRTPIYAHAFTGALNEIFLIAGLLALAGAVLAVALVRPRDFIAPAVTSAMPDEPVPESAG